MAGTDSSPSIKVRVGSLPTWADERGLLDAEVFSGLASKLVRHAIASQYVEADHPVLVEENRLIGEAVQGVHDHLEKTSQQWGPSKGAAKLAVMKRVRSLSAERLRTHDLEDSEKEEAMSRICATDLAPLFPDAWSDC